MTASNRTVALALVVAVLLAGCSAGVDAPTAEGGTGQLATSASPTEETGTLAFYVSDRPNAIGDFASLTVTVTEIGVHRASAVADDGENESPPSSTETNATGDSNATTTANSTAAATTESTPAESRSNESDDEAGWTTYAVGDRTVDLTELQGDNATRITNVSLAAGEYNGVYLAVSNVTGTLTSGETVKVKLPSERLRLNKGFALGANRSTSFVFDIAVHKAGGSGKYILRPVVGQSGADVPIREVGQQRREAGASDRGDASQSDGGENRGNGGPPEDGEDRDNRGGPADSASAAGRGAGNSSAH